ncbi:hypothetical protein M8J77_022445 [Diaphorina citri]|nr:hypothetical protein M8J77_022445 [Diaphorina citri]
MDALHSCEPLALSVDRNARVLASTSQAATCSISLPPEFFHRAPDELKREQRERSEKMELEMTLRTKAMRERDEERGREVRNYKFCIVRVKFPDNLILQGTFGVTEPFSAVLEFVREAVRPCLDQFSLSLSGLKLSGQDSGRTLLELNLVPASILNFHCDSSSIGGGREEVQAGDSYYLKPEVSVLLSD